MEPLKLMNNFDETTTSPRKKLTYPYIYIPTYGEEVGVVLSCMEQGDIPIVLKDGDVLKQVWTTILSALELQKLLRVYSFQVFVSPEVCKKVESSADLMEVVAWMVS